MKRITSMLLVVLVLASVVAMSVVSPAAKSTKPDVGFDPDYYSGSVYVDTPNVRGWFSVNGVRGWVVYNTPVYKSSSTGSTKLTTLKGLDNYVCPPFTIIRETANGKWWQIKFQQGGKFYNGYIQNNYAMINLCDLAYKGSVLENLKFDLTGYTGNTTKMNGVSIPGLTGEEVYTSAEQYCPLQYSTTMMLCRAFVNKFNKDGVGIKIFDAYRPASVQDISYEACASLYYSNAKAAYGIDASGLNVGWFIAPSGTSSHNVGVAIDMTLYNVKTGKDYIMPTAYDELSYKALKYSSGTMYRTEKDGYGGYAWGNYTSQRVGGFIPAEYMDRAMKEYGGFTCLGSEWWHFEERERSYAATRSSYYDGQPRNDWYGDRKSDAFKGDTSTTHNTISPENPSSGEWSCAAPVVSVDANDGSALVSWTNTGASKYRLYYKNAKGNWERITTVTGTSYVDTAVKEGDTRTYTVRAVNNRGNAVLSDFMRNGFTFKYLSAPEITDMDVSNGYVSVRWNKVNGAAQYRLYKAKTTGGWEALGNFKTLSYSDKTARVGDALQYTVRALDSRGNWMSDFVPSYVNHYYANPDLTVTDTSDGIKLTWDTTGYAEGTTFRVYSKVNGSWKAVRQTALSYYLDKNVSDGETKTYTIRAMSPKNDFSSYFNSGWSVVHNAE